MAWISEQFINNRLHNAVSLDQKSIFAGGAGVRSASRLHLATSEGQIEVAFQIHGAFRLDRGGPVCTR